MYILRDEACDMFDSSFVSLGKCCSSNLIKTADTWYLKYQVTRVMKPDSSLIGPNISLCDISLCWGIISSLGLCFALLSSLGRGHYIELDSKLDLLRRGFLICPGIGGGIANLSPSKSKSF